MPGSVVESESYTFCRTTTPPLTDLTDGKVFRHHPILPPARQMRHNAALTTLTRFPCDPRSYLAHGVNDSQKIIACLLFTTDAELKRHLE